MNYMIWRVQNNSSIWMVNYFLFVKEENNSLCWVPPVCGNLNCCSILRVCYSPTCFRKEMKSLPALLKAWYKFVVMNYRELYMQISTSDLYIPDCFQVLYKQVSYKSVVCYCYYKHWILNIAGVLQPDCCICFVHFALKFHLLRYYLRAFVGLQPILYSYYQPFQNIHWQALPGYCCYLLSWSRVGFSILFRIPYQFRQY